jgi:single-strand DNA-binding protein
MSLATSEYAKGEERAEWHRVVVWDEKLVDVIERRARKGTLIALEGQIRTRKWQSKDGRDVHTTEVVLDRFNSRFQILSGARGPEDVQDAGQPANQPVFDKRFAFDELPF